MKENIAKLQAEHQKLEGYAQDAKKRLEKMGVKALTKHEVLQQLEKEIKTKEQSYSETERNKLSALKRQEKTLKQEGGQKRMALEKQERYLTEKQKALEAEEAAFEEEKQYVQEEEQALENAREHMVKEVSALKNRKEKKPVIITKAVEGKNIEDLFKEARSLLEQRSFEEAKQTIAEAEMVLKSLKDEHKKRMASFDLMELKTDLKLATLV